MRSAPTTTACTRPSRITWAAIESQISVTSMPRCLQLPRRQPGALQQRPRLVGVDVQPLARFVRGEEHGQRRAVVGRRQAAGVAMREHSLAVGEQLGAESADRAAHLAVFLLDRVGFLQQRFGYLQRRRAAAAIAALRRMRSSAQNRLTAVGRLVAR